VRLAEELRADHWRDFLNHATNAGYTGLPENFDALSEEERVFVQRNFATWEERMKSVDRADRAEKERWDRLVEEAEVAGYPPPADFAHVVDYTNAQKNFFQTDFTEWKTLCQSARAARESGYSIPQNFANIPRSGQGSALKATQLGRRRAQIK
jgi:hypothetical protein